MVEKHNNYEIMKHRMQAEFASYDMDSISREWDLEREEGALTGFRLGACFMMDTFLSDEAPFESFLEVHGAISPN